MKLALLSFEYPPDTGFGGIGTYTWYQARALVKLGHDVDVFAGANQAIPLTVLEHDGVRVFRFRKEGFLMRRFRSLDKLRLWWTRNRLENAFNMFAAFREVSKRKQYDLIEMPECGAEGLLINHIARVPTLIRFHSPSRFIMPYYDVLPSDTTICSFLEKHAIRNATAFSACSRYLANEARSKLKVNKNISVIPNGIDLELFDATPSIDVHQTFNIPRNRLFIFFCGRIEPRKGSHLLKDIVSTILERYEVAFVIAGQDLFHHMRDTLMPYWQSKKLKGSIHYLGRLDQNEVRSCLRKTDIFLLPSLWENCPYSCLEAMAAGCAIVSTDHGGMPEIIENNCNGLLARTQDIASFVSCLQRLIEEPSFREQLAAAARRTIENSFTDIGVAASSVEYYLQYSNRNVKETPEPASTV